jgi:hypothetical protein
MAFDYTKFLAENELTATSRLRKKFLNEEESDKLSQLVAKKDEILAKYKSGELSLDQYRTAIGNIPQQIKNLRADLEAEQNPELGNEEGDEEIEKTGDKESDVSGVEAKLLQKSAGGSQFTDNPVSDDDEEAPSRFDMDYYQGDQDEVNEEERLDKHTTGVGGRSNITAKVEKDAEYDMLTNKLDALKQLYKDKKISKEKYLQVASEVTRLMRDITSDLSGNPDIASQRFKTGNPDFTPSAFTKNLDFRKSDDTSLRSLVGDFDDEDSNISDKELSSLKKIKGIDF